MVDLVDLKLECLELAVKLELSVDETLDAAERMLKFVTAPADEDIMHDALLECWQRLRNPTKAMADAMSSTKFEKNRPFWKAIWQRGIDAALEEDGSVG